MSVKPQELAQSSIDSAVLLANTTLDSVERLAALNLNAARSLVETSFANVNALLGAKDVQSLVALQQSLAVPALEKGLDYSRSVY
ncbi:MAG TPA: phasin family protein, partial [Rhodocyclaceae bacterium]|nr:phasin family protein [Rhodocyclaceae bacterium]